jgi:hypothetical protein
MASGRRPLGELPNGAAAATSFADAAAAAKPTARKAGATGRLGGAKRVKLDGDATPAASQSEAL